MTCKNCEKLKKENKELKEKLRKLEVEGWKSEDELIFNHIGQDWIITEHRKEKHSGNIVEKVHKIPETNVAILYTLIEKNVDSKKEIRYRELVPLVIDYYKFPIELEEFNGGVNRAKYYFQYYYYCLKVLEHTGRIYYSGRGKITLLR